MDIVSMLKEDALHNSCPSQRLLSHYAANEIERLRAEVERMRAAGDKLAEAHIDDLCDCNQSECVVIREAHAAWEEARRG